MDQIMESSDQNLPTYRAFSIAGIISV